MAPGRSLALVITLSTLWSCSQGATSAPDGGQQRDPNNWVIQAGVGGHDHGHRIVLDRTGNIYLTGTFSGTIWVGDEGPSVDSRGHYDCFVAKLTGSGKPIWINSVGGATGHDYCYGLAVDRKGSVYLGGAYVGTAMVGQTKLVARGEDDVYVAKLDSKGRFVWVRTAGGPYSDWTRKVAIDGDGGIILTGEIEGKAWFGPTILVSNGYSDIFVARYSSDGQLSWVQRLGGTAGEYGKVVVGPDALYLGGGFSGGVTGSTKIGPYTLTSKGWMDILLAELSRDGQVQWAASFGNKEMEAIQDLAVDMSGNLYATGYFHDRVSYGNTTMDAAGVSDVFVAKLDAKGKFLWAKRAGGADQDVGSDIELDSDGNIYVAGEFRKQVSFSSSTKLTAPGNESSGFVASYTPGGKLRWARSVRGHSDCASVAVLSRDVVFVTGLFMGQATFGKTTLTSRGLSDVFVWKLTVP